MSFDTRFAPTLNVSRLLIAYIILVAFASAALPLGSIHIKFDWIGAIMICVAGSIWLWNGHRINGTVLVYVVIIIFWLVINSAVAALTVQGAFNLYGFRSYFSQFTLAFLTFLMISSMYLRTEVVRRLMVFWILIACAASLLSIIQVLVGDIIVDKFLYIPYYDDEEISRKLVSGVLAPTAWFSEASWFSSFLVVPMMFVLFEVIGVRKSSESRLFYWAAALMIVTGLFVAFSLTAILSVFIGILAIFLLSARSRLPILLLALIGFGLFFVLSDAERVVLQLLRFTELFNNLFDFSAGSHYYGTTTSFYVRSVGFIEGLSVFLENPVFGIGIGQGERPFHSGFITLLAEQGILGTILYFFPLMWIIRKLTQIRKCGDPLTRHLATILVIALVADYANGLVTHNSFHLQRWLLISIAFGWLFSLRRQSVADSASIDV